MKRITDLLAADVEQTERYVMDAGDFVRGPNVCQVYATYEITSWTLWKLFFLRNCKEKFWVERSLKEKCNSQQY